MQLDSVTNLSLCLIMRSEQTRVCYIHSSCSISIMYKSRQLLVLPRDLDIISSPGLHTAQPCYIVLDLILYWWAHSVPKRCCREGKSKRRVCPWNACRVVHFADLMFRYGRWPWGHLLHLPLHGISAYIYIYKTFSKILCFPQFTITYPTFLGGYTKVWNALQHPKGFFFFDIHPRPPPLYGATPLLAIPLPYDTDRSLSTW